MCVGSYVCVCNCLYKMFIYVGSYVCVCNCHIKMFMYVGSYVCVMCKHSYLLLLYAAVLLPYCATPGDPIVIQCIAIAMAATNTQCIYSGNSFLLQLYVLVQPCWPHLYFK